MMVKHMERVIREGFTLRYVIEGHGLPAIVLGSALYGSRSFSQHLRGHLRMAFVDFRGFAESAPTPCPSNFTLQTLCEDIEAFRQTIGFSRCIIIGHSAFSLLALEYAKHYPDHISHVVMVGSSPNLGPEMAKWAQRNWEESVWPERKAALERRIQQFPDAEMGKLSPSERFVAWCVRRAPQTWYDYNFDSSPLWEGIHPHMPILDHFYGNLLRDFDVTQGLETFHKPVLLALGRFEFILAPSSAWDPIRPKFHDLTVRIFERSGHCPHYEEAPLFDQELLSWLSTRSEKKTKQIVVSPYNPDWPKSFAREAATIEQALGSNCIAVHHIGSTAVPGLSAKPIIDMIVVVKDPEQSIQPLEALGLKYKGEYNIPMRYYYSRSEGENVAINLHVYEEDHPEIELNLLFRDYLRSHEEACKEYALLKENLLQEKSSYEKNNSLFTGYNLGKAAFIRNVLKAAHFNRIRIMKCTHHAEWEVAKRLRQRDFFDPLALGDPYTWTFNHPDHAHLVLYQGVDIIGYAHIQFWPDHRAALRIFVLDEDHRRHGLGCQFLGLCEQWLKRVGVKSLHDEARPNSVDFYRKNGYTEMPFDDPSGVPPSPHDVAMGKRLN